MKFPSKPATRASWLVFLPAVCFSLSLTGLASPQEQDFIEGPIHWVRDDPTSVEPSLHCLESTAIHVTLLPDGRLLLFGYTQPFPALEFFVPLVFTMTPTPPYADLPTAQCPPDSIRTVPECTPGHPATRYEHRVKPLAFFQEPGQNKDTLYCSGHTLASDGNVLVAGGTRGFGTAEGLDYAQVFDYDGGPLGTGEFLPMSGTPKLAMLGTGQVGTARRWYPTVTRLPSEHLLITTGWEQLSQGANRSVDLYQYDPMNPSGGQFYEVSKDSCTPMSPMGIMNPDYTHAFVLPEEDMEVLMFGEEAYPVTLDVTFPPPDCTTQSPWSVSSAQRPQPTPPLSNPNDGASTVMLPIRLPDDEFAYNNGTILHCGGFAEVGNISRYAKEIDFYDPIAGWNDASDGLPMVLGAQVVDRHHPSTVLLPTERVLILAGHSHDASLASLTRFAHYVEFKPGTGAQALGKDRFQLTTGTSQMCEIRGYHTAAALLSGRPSLHRGGASIGLRARALPLRVLLPRPT